MYRLKRRQKMFLKFMSGCLILKVQNNSNNYGSNIASLQAIIIASVALAQL